MSIINWEYYSSHFPTVVPQRQFEAVEAQAEAEYNRIAKPYMQIPDERAQDTVFKLCNFLWTNQPAVAGRAVTSVNNNGYSESYAITNPEQVQQSIDEIIYKGIGTRLAGAF